MKTLDILSTIGALVLAATPLAVADAAHAAPATAVAIPVADLDFANGTDVSRFNTRVIKAAARLCSGVDTRELSQMAACQSAVREEAVSQLGVQQRQQMAARPVANRQVASR